MNNRVRVRTAVLGLVHRVRVHIEHILPLVLDIALEREVGESRREALGIRHAEIVTVRLRRNVPDDRVRRHPVVAKFVAAVI